MSIPRKISRNFIFFLKNKGSKIDVKNAVIAIQINAIEALANFIEPKKQIQ